MVYCQGYFTSTFSFLFYLIFEAMLKLVNKQQNKEMAWISNSSYGKSRLLEIFTVFYTFIYFGCCSIFLFFSFMCVYLCIVYFYKGRGFLDVNWIHAVKLSIVFWTTSRTTEELQTSTKPASCSPQNSRTLHCSAFFLSFSLQFPSLVEELVCVFRSLESVLCAGTLIDRVPWTLNFD